MPINLGFEDLSKIETVTETASAISQIATPQENFEQRALYWVEIVNKMVSSLNQLFNNVKDNPLIAGKLAERFDFNLPSTEKKIVNPVVSQPQQQQQPQSIVKQDVSFIVLEKFLGEVIKRGYGKMSVKQLFQLFYKKLEQSEVIDYPLENLYRDLTERKSEVNDILKKFMEKNETDITENKNRDKTNKTKSTKLEKKK